MLEEQVHERRAAREERGEEKIRVPPRERLIDEADRTQRQRAEVEARRERRREDDAQLARGVIDLGEGGFEEAVVQVVRHRRRAACLGAAARARSRWITPSTIAVDEQRALIQRRAEARARRARGHPSLPDPSCPPFVVLGGGLRAAHFGARGADGSGQPHCALWTPSPPRSCCDARVSARMSSHSSTAVPVSSCVSSVAALTVATRRSRPHARSIRAAETRATASRARPSSYSYLSSKSAPENLYARAWSQSTSEYTQATTPATYAGP